jgi:hypothetical protein
MWRGSQEMYDAKPWTHYLTIIELPWFYMTKHINDYGGSTGVEPDLTDLVTMALPFISATGTVVPFYKPFQ